jgi:hypothetical protein
MTERLDAVHVEHTGLVTVRRPLAEAFPLFTPEGERAWAPGWEPEYLHPPDGTPGPGLTFRTRAGGEETLWYVARFDPVGGGAEYVRITPGSRLGTVTIQCEQADPGFTTVRVTYRLTAVSQAGNAALEAFNGPAFAEMMQEWERRIDALVRPAASSVERGTHENA